MKKRVFTIQITSIILLIFAFFLAITIGAEKIRLSDFFNNFNHSTASTTSNPFTKIIILDLRLPRALLVLLTGILLGGSGAVFQLFFRNPLAEPGIMGISSGATLGAVLANVFITYTGFQLGLQKIFSANLSDISILNLISPVNFAAFLGALGAGALVTALAFSSAGKKSSVMLLLCGTALGTLYSSISSIVLLSSSKELHSVYTWILGSFNGRGWKELIFILIPSFFSILIMFIISRPLDLLTCGEETAQSLGVEVNKLRILVLICGSLAVSAAVCAGGTISFVGLIAPHIVRKIIGSKSKVLIPYSMIFGAILLLLSDTLARVVIAPSELPAGIITAILGVPFFLSLCLKK